jgi:hypothetical protein
MIPEMEVEYDVWKKIGAYRKKQVDIWDRICDETTRESCEMTAFRWKNHLQEIMYLASKALKSRLK